MPKEITYGDSPAFMLDKDGNELLASEQPPGAGQVLRRGVIVGWSRQQYVEVGVARLEVSGEGLEVGQFTTLDREGINRLIRNLRKARDQAFGADA